MERAIQLLNLSANEITSLRRSNELMQARLGMFDDVMQIMHARLPSQGSVHSPDVVQEINNFIKEQPVPVKDNSQTNTQ